MIKNRFILILLLANLNIVSVFGMDGPNFVPKGSESEKLSLSLSKSTKDEVKIEDEKKAEDPKKDSKAEATSSSVTRPIVKTQAELNQLVAEKFKALCQDMEDRLKLAESGDVTVLDKGFWYPEDYFKLLEKKPKRKERKEFLLDRDYFRKGYPPKNKLSLVFNKVSDAEVPFGIYALKKGVTPSEALDALVHDLCFIDCTIVLQIAYYQVLRDLWGTEKFNSYILRYRPVNNVFVSSYFFRYDMPLLHFVDVKGVDVGAPGRRNVQVGAKYYIRNHPLYLHKDRLGSGTGFNVMCLDATPGRQRFTGLGLPSNGASEAEIIKICIDEFNKDPLNAAICRKENWPRLSQEGGYTEQTRQLLKNVKITEADFENNNLNLSGITQEQLRQLGVNTSNLGKSGFEPVQSEMILDLSKINSVNGVSR